MSPARRRQVVDREHPSLSLVRQCTLLGVSRSSLYYRPNAASAEDLSLMGESDRQYLETPFFGSRRMKAWLDRRGMPVSRQRVQRLMRAMGLRAIYRRPSTSRRSPEHPVYAYLLRNVKITRPNEVWAADITYLGPGVPLPGGGDGLAQPVCAGLASVQYPGGWLLRRGAGGNPDQGMARGVQHRPSLPLRRQGEASSPVGSSPRSSRTGACGSAWTGRGGTRTTSAWSGCGGR